MPRKNIDIMYDNPTTIKYKVIDDIMFKIFNITGEPRKKQIKEVIKLEYISAYTKCECGDYKEEDEIKYAFLKALIELLNIKM